MDGQEASGKAPTEQESVQNVEKGTGHFEGIQECCQSMQGSDEEKLRSIWNESWQGMSMTTRKTYSVVSVRKGKLEKMSAHCWMRLVSW